MVKASEPHNTEGSVTVTQSLEHTKNPATAGPVFTTGQIPRFKVPQKENAEYIFIGTKVQLALLDATTSLGTDLQQHQWMRLATSLHPHHFFSIPHVPSTYKQSS